MVKCVYSFGDGVAEGGAGMRETLGDKGALLAEMTNLGIPVPPGFIISAEAYALFSQNQQKLPKELKEEITAQLSRLEELTGKRFGDTGNPLLLSVRSSPLISMPPMMDAVLNLGLTDKIMQALAKTHGNPRFAWDVYRRFVKNYGIVVLGIPEEPFETAFMYRKASGNITRESGLDAQYLADLTGDYKKIIKYYKKSIPQKPAEQLWEAVSAVFCSWKNAGARACLNISPAEERAGTAVVIQMMVYGNFNGNSGTGICFSRDPSTGENNLYGEYLINAQGEDVIAGGRIPEKIAKLAKQNPDIYRQLITVRNILEKHFQDMQEMEFTFQEDALYLLQTRAACRSGEAAIKCAFDMTDEKLIDKKAAIQRITPECLEQSMRPQFNFKPKGQKPAKALTSGFNAVPGAASGCIAFSAEIAEKWHEAGEPVIFIRKYIRPGDIAGLAVSQGVLTSTGGITSYAAALARKLGIPCISANTVVIQGKRVVIGPKRFKEGDRISIDGLTGAIFAQELPLVLPCLTEAAQAVLAWSDAVQIKAARNAAQGFTVYGRVDTPQDVPAAYQYGAAGIVFYRLTSFFTAGKIIWFFQIFFLARTAAERKKALKMILPLLKKVFADIFAGLKGKPALLCFFETLPCGFLPQSKAEINALAKYLHTTSTALQHSIETLRSSSLLSGGRECRLAGTYHEIYEMQAEAFALAVEECAGKGIPVHPDIIIPAAATAQETALVRSKIETVLTRIIKKNLLKTPFRIGVMIKTPRAALMAEEFAESADFFCFETRELTCAILALSEKNEDFLVSANRTAGTVDQNAFISLDKTVCKLMRLAISQGRAVKPGLWISACGTHGGDPQTINFYYHAGLDMAACAPTQIPIARLAGAHAVLRAAAE